MKRPLMLTQDTVRGLGWTVTGQRLRRFRENHSDRWRGPGRGWGPLSPRGQRRAVTRASGRHPWPPCRSAQSKASRADRPGQPAHTPPSSATASAVGLFQQVSTESFLAVMQAHCPQVCAGGDSGLCVRLLVPWIPAAPTAGGSGA